MKKFINDLIYFEHIHYDDGTETTKLRVHPVVIGVIIILLVVGGYLVY